MERPCQAVGSTDVVFPFCFFLGELRPRSVPAGAAHRKVVWPERRGAGKGAPVCGAAKRTLAGEHRSGMAIQLRWAVLAGTGSRW
jgi:hypothetical protein